MAEVLIIHASVFGEPGKKLPYTTFVPDTIMDKTIIVEAPCLSFRIELLTKPEHSVKNIIDKCLEYRKTLAKKKKKGILGSSTISLSDNKFSLTIRGKKRPKKLSKDSTVSSLRLKPQVF